MGRFWSAIFFPRTYMDVSKNRGTPKWMVYNGKPYWNGWFWGYPYFFGNTHILSTGWQKATTYKTHPRDVPMKKIPSDVRSINQPVSRNHYLDPGFKSWGLFDIFKYSLSKKWHVLGDRLFPWTPLRVDRGILPVTPTKSWTFSRVFPKGCQVFDCLHVP